jgi:hypothetical protein
MFVFPGFNSNIDHRNKKYHIQTEVNSVKGINKINTLVYFSGMIYFSISSQMGTEDAASRETALSAVRRQHNKVIRDLISDQLAPQQTLKNNELIDFAAMYKDEKFFSCRRKSQQETRDVFKELIIVPDGDK